MPATRQLVSWTTEVVEEERGESGVAAHPLVVNGDPADVLVRHSAKADLLVLGSRGHGALATLAPGSTWGPLTLGMPHRIGHGGDVGGEYPSNRGVVTPADPARRAGRLEPPGETFIGVRMPMEVHIMFPTPTERTAVVLAEGGAGAALGAGSATAAELEMTGLLIAASVSLFTATASEVLAIVGVLIWATALLVPITFDAWRRVRRLRSRRASRKGATHREVAR